MDGVWGGWYACDIRYKQGQLWGARLQAIWTTGVGPGSVEAQAGPERRRRRGRAPVQKLRRGRKRSTQPFTRLRKAVVRAPPWATLAVVDWASAAACAAMRRGAAAKGGTQPLVNSVMVWCRPALREYGNAA